MRKTLFFSLCGAMFLFIMLVNNFVVSRDTYGDDSLIVLHSDAAKHSADCTGCHGDRTDEKSLDSKIPSIHTTHLKQKIFKDKGCVYCHKSVDLEESSGATIRKQVDVKQICTKCHAQKFYKGGK